MRVAATVASWRRKAATIQLQPPVARWAYGAVLPCFLRVTSKTDLYMKSFDFLKMAKNSADQIWPVAVHFQPLCIVSCLLQQFSVTDLQ